MHTYAVYSGIYNIYSIHFSIHCQCCFFGCCFFRFTSRLSFAFPLSLLLSFFLGVLDVQLPRLFIYTLYTIYNKNLHFPHLALSLQTHTVFVCERSTIIISAFVHLSWRYLFSFVRSFGLPKVFGVELFEFVLFESKHFWSASSHLFYRDAFL